MSSGLSKFAHSHTYRYRTPRIAHITKLSGVKLTVKQIPALAVEAVRSSNDAEMTEEKMRRALGLSGQGTRPTLTIEAAPSRQAIHEPALPGPCRRKSASVGSTSTGVLSPLQQRVTELEQQLAAERHRHGDARQLLQRAEQAVHTLETRFQHVIMAQEEELDAARQATVRAQRALDNALFEVQQRAEAQRSARATAQEQANQPMANETPMITADTNLDAVSWATPADISSPPKKRGRPRTRPIPEPKPVRWWTPSFKAKAKV